MDDDGKIAAVVVDWIYIGVIRMKQDEALQIIVDEQLKFYNWFHEHKVRPNEVLIEKLGEKWCVSAADERACIAETSRTYFDNEEDALERFIKLVRLEKIYIC